MEEDYQQRLRSEINLIVGNVNSIADMSDFIIGGTPRTIAEAMLSRFRLYSQIVGLCKVYLCSFPEDEEVRNLYGEIGKSLEKSNSNLVGILEYDVKNFLTMGEKRPNK